MANSISVNTLNCVDFKNKAASDRLFINARKLRGSNWFTMKITRGEAIYGREKDLHNKKHVVFIVTVVNNLR